jgi:hypothetical protein
MSWTQAFWSQSTAALANAASRQMPRSDVVAVTGQRRAPPALERAPVTQQERVSSTLASGGTALAALQRFGAARVQARSLKGQARAEDMNARMELANADIASTAATERYLETVSRNQVGAAASGIDVASGSVRAVQDGARDELTSYLAGVRNNAVAASYTRAANAASMRAQAKQLRLTAFLNLLSDGANAMSQAASAGGGGGA